MKRVPVVARGLLSALVAFLACAEPIAPKPTPPATPVNVAATLISPTSVMVSWSPNPASDGVVGYNILRNGAKAGESTSTSFTDTGLSEQTIYRYTVSASAASGLQSPPSPESPGATVETPDVSPPLVTSHSPLNGSAAVSTFASLTVTFSEPMDPATITTASFTLRITSGGASIPGTVTYNAATRLAEFKPASQLPSMTSLTATVATAAKDLAGNALAAPFTFVFTTLDETPPTVVATSPVNGATGVSANSQITVTFSEPMDPATINSTNFTLRLSGSGAFIAGTVAYNTGTSTASNTAALVPSSPLAFSTSYIVSVSSGATDLAHNGLASAFTSSFSTSSAPDVTPPTIVSTSPLDGATNVPTTAVITVTFSEAMDPATINATTFAAVHTGSGAVVAGTVTYDAAASKATLTPASPLSQNTTYLATITTGAKDLAGNALSANVPFAFKIEPPAQPVVVVSVNTGQQFQTIEGWGVSMRMFTDPHIIGLPQDDPVNALQISPSAQAEILDSLYRGIGLTRVRVASDPAGIEPENDNGDPFNTDLTKFNFSGRNNDAFFGVTSDLLGRGVTHWWMSPIAIEPFMDESNPDEYVEWAMAINRRWRASGLELPYYSIANEPTRLGTPLWSATYMRDVVKLLGHKLRSEGFSTRLVVPDDISPSAAGNMAQTILADADARQFVGAIAYHLYGEPVTESAGLRALSAQYGIPLWMSEYYQEDWMDWGTLVQALLSDYNVTAVDYLAGFLGEESGGAALISLRHSGTQYNGYRIQSQYYSFGNFTRYVRPGAVRVAATSSDSDVQVSAFMQGGRLTLVGINHHDTNVTVRFDLGATSSNSFSSVRTSSDEHLVPLSPVAVSSGSIVVVLKAASITTLYQ